MNARSIVAIALLVPVIAGAQRRSNVGRNRPEPTPLPKPAPTLAREMSYVPRPYSLDSYMFLSFTQTPSAMAGKSISYGALAAGERLDYRLGERFSVTGDVTAILFGGPEMTLSYELGGRFLPVKRSAMKKFRPYIDARYGYFVTGINSQSNGVGAVNPATTLRFRSGHGHGAVAGLGADRQITKSMWLTTGAWVARTNLRAYTSEDLYVPGSSMTGRMSQYRLALGVKWNPGFYIPMPGDSR